MNLKDKIYNTSDINMSECVDESMEIVNMLKHNIHDPEVKELIERESAAIDKLLNWVDIH